MTAELFSIATRPTSGLNRLHASLSRLGIALSILRCGEEYRGHGWRWKTFVRAAHSSEADVVIHSDAFDCVCLRPLDELLEKFQLLKHPIVFSFECHAQPEYWLALNPGLMVAQRDAFQEVFSLDGLDEGFPDHFNDMSQIQMLYSWHPDWFKLDTHSRIFYTQNSGASRLLLRDGRLVVPETDAEPCFVHGPNNSDLSNVDDWLRTA